MSTAPANDAAIHSSRDSTLAEIFSPLDFKITSGANRRKISSSLANVSTKDIIGSRAHGKCNQLSIYYYPLSLRKHYRKRHEIILQFRDQPDLTMARHQMVQAVQIKPCKFLVVLNPYGGAKKAKDYLDKVVKPMLFEAEINFEVVTTEHCGHATEIGRNYDTSKFDGICALSGDGTLHEIINGISQRTDGTKIDDVPIGILNGGTANCLVAAILERRGERKCNPNKAIWNATFAFIKGNLNRVDLLMTRYADQELYLCQSLSWGLICDVEFESEWLRVFGSTRYSIYAIKHIMLNKCHQGTISYIPESVSEAPEIFQKYLSNRPKEADFHQGNQTWHTFPGNKFSFVALMVNGFWSLDNVANPFSHLDDGKAYLMVVPKPVSRLSLLKFFLQLESGNHASSPQIQFICVKQVKFNFDKERAFNLDGEKSINNVMEADVRPHSATMIY